MTNCESGRTYPFKVKRKMCYTSPTSGHVRCGEMSLHCSENNKEYAVVRAIGGGTRRDYAWKQHFSPA